MQSGEILDEPVLRGKAIFKNLKAKFGVTDESHRAAASTYRKALKEYISEHKETKFLGITATPVRSADDEDFLRDCAIELGQDDYIAQEIYLLDAMEEGIVVTPDVKYFPCLLDESKEYLTVMNKYLKACRENNKDSSSTKFLTYKIILQEMHKAMGMDEDLSNKLLEFSREEIDALGEIKSITELKNRSEWDKIKEEKIQDIIYPNNKENPNAGKTIIFVPPAKGEEDALTVINKFKDKFRKYFSKDKISLLEPYHSASSDTNDQTMEKFNNPEKDSGIVAILTNKMADEGFHPDDIRNLSFFEEISANDGQKKKKATDEVTPKTNLTQKIGRGVFGIMGKDESEYEIPRIFDFANNFGRHRQTLIDMEKGINIFKIPRNIQYFFKLAEIGSKELKDHSKIFTARPDGTADKLKGFRFFGKSKKDIIEISCIDCNDTENIDIIDYDASKSQNSNEIKKYDPKKEIDKFELLINTLEQLKNLNIEYTQISEDTILNKDFFEKRENITESQIKDFYKNMTKLGFAGMETRSYFIGEALDIFRKAFWRDKDVSSKYYKVFDEYSNYEKLVELGIMEVDLENLPERLATKVRKDGFIMVNEQFPESLIGINVKTGTYFDENNKDEYGCREDGLDDEGYDKYGFNEYGIHKKTQCKYDERYFYKNDEGEWINKYTGKDVDVFGYNRDGINEQTGFDRGDFDKIKKSGLYYLVHLWHKKINGKFSRIGKLYSEDQDGNKIEDFNGFESGRSSRLRESQSIKNSRGFFRDRTTGDRTSVNRLYYVYDAKLDRDLDINRVDIDGFHFPENYKKGDPVFNVFTSSPYDKTGKDINSKYPESFNIAIDVCKSLLAGKSLSQIKKDMEAKEINLDTLLYEAYQHFLVYKDFILGENEIKKLYDKILKNGAIVNEIGEEISSIKSHMWEIAKSSNKARIRTLEGAKITQTIGGGKVEIKQTINENLTQTYDASFR